MNWFGAEKKEQGFPEIKVIKQLIRDLIAPKKIWATQKKKRSKEMSTPKLYLDFDFSLNSAASFSLAATCRSAIFIFSTFHPQSHPARSPSQGFQIPSELKFRPY